MGRAAAARPAHAPRRSKVCARSRPTSIALQEVRQIPGACPIKPRRWRARSACSTTSKRRRPGAAATRGWRSCRASDRASATCASCRTRCPTERRLVLGVTVDRRSARSTFTTHLNYRLADGSKREDQIVAVDELSPRRRVGAAQDPHGRLQRHAATPTRFAFCAGCTRSPGKRVF